MLIRKASVKGFEATRDSWSDIISQNDDEPFEALVQFYVSPNDPDAYGTRCMFVVLNSDAAGVDPSIQEAFVTGLLGYLEVIYTIIPSASSEVEQRDLYTWSAQSSWLERSGIQKIILQARFLRRVERT